MKLFQGMVFFSVFTGRLGWLLIALGLTIPNSFFISSSLATPNVLTLPDLDPHGIELTDNCDANLRNIPTELAITNERHPFSALWAPDPALGGKTLLEASPFSIMNAAQRIRAVLRSEKAYEIPDPRLGVGRTLRRFPVLSDGTEITNGRRIISNDEAITTFMSILDVLAEGAGSGRTFPVFVGGPGSGKSEFIHIIRASLHHQTSRNPRFATYSYRFKDLNQIPSLADLMPRDGYYESPLHDSPFTLLPPNIQSQLLSRHERSIREWQGVSPRPKLTPSSHCQYIVAQLLNHYYPHQIPSERDILRILNQHVEITRIVLGSDTTTPIIDFKPKGTAFDRLLARTNPRILAETNLAHPLAWDLTGPLLQGNGSAGLIDEILKNPEDFTNMLLAFAESRQANVGSASIPVDMVILGATNMTEIAKLVANQTPATPGGRPEKNPFLDRITQIPMNWHLRPAAEIRTLAMSLGGLEARPLRQDLGDTGSYTTVGRGAHLDQVFPDHTNPKIQAVYSDGRYDLRMPFVDEDGRANSIHIAPRSLTLLARVAVLSRLVFDRPTIMNFLNQFPDGSREVATPTFLQLADRLAMLEGESLALNDSALAAYWSFSDVTREGSFGLSHRDIERRWFGPAIGEARRTRGRHHCLSPLLLRETLLDVARKGEIGSTPLERSKWTDFVSFVMHHYVIPGYRYDIYRALAQNQGESIETLYDIVFREMMEISQRTNPNSAIEISDPVTGRKRPVNMDRYRKICEIYKRINGRDLRFEEINLFASQRRLQSATADVRHQGLMRALTEYQASAVLSSLDVELASLLQAADQDTNPTIEARSAHNQLLETLMEKHGYCPICVSHAVQLITEERSYEGQQRR